VQSCDGDVDKIGYASPTAFYHEKSESDKERRVLVNRKELKIIIFLDQPNDEVKVKLKNEEGLAQIWRECWLRMDKLRKELQILEKRA
jgi:hypothetical protein